MLQVFDLLELFHIGGPVGRPRVWPFLRSRGTRDRGTSPGATYQLPLPGGLCGPRPLLRGDHHVGSIERTEVTILLSWPSILLLSLHLSRSLSLSLYLSWIFFEPPTRVFNRSKPIFKTSMMIHQWVDKKGKILTGNHRFSHDSYGMFL